jgi:hypothetical protein
VRQLSRCQSRLGRFVGPLAIQNESRHRFIGAIDAKAEAGQNSGAQLSAYMSHLGAEDAEYSGLPVMRLTRSDFAGATAIAVVIFIVDWSGFRPYRPDLFAPNSLRDVWWHFPAIEAAMVLSAAIVLAFQRER